MKKTTIIITVILLVLNILLGLLISSFKPFNIVFTSLIILLTGGLIYLLQSITLKDAFAISLSFVYATLGLIEYILAILSPKYIQDNGYVIATTILIVIEGIILLICNLTSNKIE